MRKVTKPKASEIPETLGGRIAYARTNKEMSQETLAEKLLLKREYVNMFETDTRIPKVEVLRDIAKHLDVSTDYLLGLTDAPTIALDKRNAADYTGLSQKAVETLFDYKKRVNFEVPHNTPVKWYKLHPAIDLLLTTEQGNEVLQAIFDIALSEIEGELNCKYTDPLIKRIIPDFPKYPFAERNPEKIRNIFMVDLINAASNLRNDIVNKKLKVRGKLPNEKL